VDTLQDYWRLFQDLMVPESKHTVTKSLQVFGSCLIFVQLLAMLATISLDDQLCFDAGEVDNI